MTRVFNHQELRVLCRNRKPSTRDKLIAMIGGEVKEQEIYRRDRLSEPEKAFKLAALQR